LFGKGKFEFFSTDSEKISEIGKNLKQGKCIIGSEGWALLY